MFLGLFYRKCKLVSKAEVTHDTKLFCLMLPKGTHLHVPTGQHVYLKQIIAGKKNWECSNEYIHINPFHSVENAKSMVSNSLVIVGKFLLPGSQSVLNNELTGLIWMES